MPNYYFIVLTIFGVIGYLMITDPNLNSFISLIPRIIKLTIEKLIWRIRLHPFWFMNKFGQWRMTKKYQNYAIKLENEPKDETDTGTTTSRGH